MNIVNKRGKVKKLQTYIKNRFLIFTKEVTENLKAHPKNGL